RQANLSIDLQLLGKKEEETPEDSLEQLLDQHIKKITEQLY
ncbi:15556_t:CDS:1, partial [Racocetra persica]